MRKRPRKQPEAQFYQHKVECLAELERLSERGLIELYYADESRVSMQPCVPYAWQFKDEEVFMPAGNGAGLNCFALLSRNNYCRFATTQGRITSAFLIEQLERLSLELPLEIDHATPKTTVVVLDNAPTHLAKSMRERRPIWEKRGLVLFFLPTYSPHLNLAEVLWRKLKYEWLQPEDYFESQTLFYRVNQALAAVGTLLHINFAPFRLG